jgi:hypothetical protein
MADWVTISSLATASGTLVLAAATFASVRSGNRSARVAERALLLGIRPVLVPTRPEDPPEKVTFVDDRKYSVRGGTAAVESADGIVYIVVALRNVGAGPALIEGGHVTPGRVLADTGHPDPEEFWPLQRDLFVPAGDTGYWQRALREPTHAMRDGIVRAVAEGDRLTAHIMYSDHEGGQRTITRFVLTPHDGTEWVAAVTRHWNLDREAGD